MVSKQYAKRAGLKRYYTGKLCKNGNVADRLTSTGNCLCLCCRDGKNRQNSNYYYSIRNEDWFIRQSEDYRNSRKEEKSRYDKEYRERNREKVLFRAMKWNRNNPEKRRAIVSNYRDRRRSQEDGGISSADLSEWISSQIKICYWCGRKCEESFHVDHYVPLSRGGKHEADNLVIACPPCNIRKNAKDPYEFANSVGRLF